MNSIPVNLFYLLIIILAAVTTVLLAVILNRKKTGAVPLELIENITTRLNQIEKISTQVDGLTNIFLLPRARGGVGETVLDNLLGTYLPKKFFTLQHGFKNGARVDAVIRVGEKIVPVDAKFPLESIRNFLAEQTDSGEEESRQTKTKTRGELRRVFIKHGREIAEKYIHPAEGTLGFALMYVPSERIYYAAFIENEDNLLQEIFSLNVIPVSPGSMFLYLQTVIYGMKGLTFSGKQHEFARNITQLKKDFGELTRIYGVLGNHIKNMHKSYEESLSRYARVEGDIGKLDTPE